MASKDKKNYTIQITQRFLEAVDNLVGYDAGEKITYKSLCERLSMTSSNLSRLRRTPEFNSPTLEAIALLCSEFNISAEWIMLGKKDKLESPETRLAKLEKRVKALERKK